MPVSSTSGSFSSVYNKCLELEAKIAELDEKYESKAKSSGSIDEKLREEFDNLSVTVHDLKETLTDIDMNTTSNIAKIAELRKKINEIEKSVSTVKVTERATSCAATNQSTIDEILQMTDELKATVGTLPVRNDIGVKTFGEFLNVLADAQVTLKKAVDELTSKVTANEDAITKLQETVAGISVDVPQTQIDRNTLDIAVLESKVESSNTSISTLENLIKKGMSVITGEETIPSEEEFKSFIQSIKDTIDEVKSINPEKINNDIKAAMDKAIEVEEKLNNNFALTKQILNFCGTLDSFTIGEFKDSQTTVELEGVYDPETEENEKVNLDTIIDVNGVIYLAPLDNSDKPAGEQIEDEIQVYSVTKTSEEMHVVIPKYVVVINDNEFKAYRVKTFFPILEKFNDMTGIYCNDYIYSMKMDWITELVHVNNFCAGNNNLSMISLPRCDEIRACNYFGAGKKFSQETHLEIPISCKLMPSENSEKMRRAWNVLNIFNQFNSFMGCIWSFVRIDRSLRINGEYDNTIRSSIYGKDAYLNISPETNKVNHSKKGYAFRSPVKRSDSDTLKNLGFDLYSIPAATLKILDIYAIENPIVDGVMPTTTITGDYSEAIVTINEALAARRNGMQIDIAKIKPLALPPSEEIELKERVIAADTESTTVKLGDEKVTVDAVNPDWNLRDRITAFCHTTCKGLLMLVRQVYENEDLRTSVFDDSNKFSKPFCFVIEALEAILGNVSNISSDVNDDQQFSNINSNFVSERNEDDVGAHTLYSYFSAMVGVTTNKTAASEESNNTIFGTAGLYFPDYITENAVNNSMISLSTNLDGSDLPKATPITEEYHSGALRSKHTDIMGVPRTQNEGKNIEIPSNMKYGYEHHTHTKVVNYFKQYGDIATNFITQYNKLLKLVKYSFYMDPIMNDVSDVILSNVDEDADLVNDRGIYNFIGAYPGNTLSSSSGANVWWHPVNDGNTTAGNMMCPRQHCIMNDTRDNACVLPFNSEGPITSLIYATNKALVIGAMFNVFVNMFQTLGEVMRTAVCESELDNLINDRFIQMTSNNNNDGFYKGLVLGTFSEKIASELIDIAYANYNVIADPEEDTFTDFNNVNKYVEEINTIRNDHWRKQFSDSLSSYSFNQTNLEKILSDIDAACNNNASRYLIMDSNRQDQGESTYDVPQYYQDVVGTKIMNNTEIFSAYGSDDFKRTWNGPYTIGESEKIQYFSHTAFNPNVDDSMVDPDGIINFFHYPAYVHYIRAFTVSSYGATENSRYLFFTTDGDHGFELDKDSLEVKCKQVDEKDDYSTQIGYRYALAKYTHKSGKWTPMNQLYYKSNINKLRNIDDIYLLLNNAMVLGGIVSQSILKNSSVAYKSNVPTIFNDEDMVNVNIDTIAIGDGKLTPMYLGKYNMPSSRMTHWFQQLTESKVIDGENEGYKMLTRFVKNILSMRLYQSNALSDPRSSVYPYAAAMVMYYGYLNIVTPDEQLKDMITPILDKFENALSTATAVIDDREFIESGYNEFTTIADECINELVDLINSYSGDVVMPGENYVSYIETNIKRLYNILHIYDYHQTMTVEQNEKLPNWKVDMNEKISSIDYGRFVTGLVLSFTQYTKCIMEVYLNLRKDFENIISAQALADAYVWKLILQTYSDSSDVIRFQQNYSYIDPESHITKIMDINVLSGAQLQSLFGMLRNDRLNITKLLSSENIEKLRALLDDLTHATAYSAYTITAVNDNALRSAGMMLQEISYHTETVAAKSYLRSIRFLPSERSTLFAASSPYAIDTNTSYVPPTYTKKMEVYTLPLMNSIEQYDTNAVYQDDDGLQIHEFNIYIPASALMLDSFVGEVKYNNKIIAVDGEGKWNDDSIVVNSFLPCNCGCGPIIPFGSQGANAHTKLSLPETAFITPSRVMSHEWNGVPSTETSTIDRVRSDKYYGLWPATEINQTPAHTEEGATYPFVTQKDRVDGISFNEALKIINSNFLVGRDRIIPRLNEEGVPENSDFNDEGIRIMSDHFEKIDGVSIHDNFEPTLVAITSLKSPSLENQTYSEYMPCVWDKGNYTGLYIRAPVKAGDVVREMVDNEIYGDYTFADTEWFYNKNTKTYGFAGEAFHGTYERHYRFY